MYFYSFNWDLTEFSFLDMRRFLTDIFEARFTTLNNQGMAE